MATLRSGTSGVASLTGHSIMALTSKLRPSRLKFHPDAYRFVFEALQYSQEHLKKVARDVEDDSAHISGPELLEGVRELGLKKFGMLAKSVFGYWGVKSTDDFGRIVFELIDHGEMRKTDRDQLSDFFDVYNFDQALVQNYQIDTAAAFKRSPGPTASDKT